MTQQQYCVTGLNEAISLYKQRKIPAYTALMMYFRIRFAPGWNGIVNYGAIQELFDMARSTFYRVLRRLLADGEIAVSQESGRRIHRLSGNDFSAPFDEEELSDAREKPPTRGIGFGRRKQRKSKPETRPRSSDSPPKTSAYASFLETLPPEQRQDFEAFCHRKVESSWLKIESPTAWLNKHYPEYWAEFERQYIARNAPVSAPEIPQKLKDALAAGKAQLERHFFKGEFVTGVFSLDGKGWFNSIEEWLASC